MAEARVGRSFDAIELLHGGRANLNLRLDGERVLRIYERDPATSVKERELLEKGWTSFRVPRVLAHGPDFLLLEWLGLRPLLDTAEHGERVGRAAAEIHGTRFDEAGFLDRDLEVVAPLPPWSSVAAAFEELGGAWAALGARVAALHPGGAAKDGWGAGVLNHGDFKVSNLFVDPHGALVVLDWEYAFSGPPLFDLGQLFRWGTSEPFAEGFVRGYEESGGDPLPSDWQARSRALDLANLVGLARGAAPDSLRTADLQHRIERTLSRSRT